MAEVYLSRDLEVPDRIVALKLRRRDLAPDMDAVARFLDEARVSTLLDHPNIVKVYDVGVHDGRYYMAMEWLLGWELKEVLDRMGQVPRSMPVPIALQIVADAA